MSNLDIKTTIVREKALEIKNKINNMKNILEEITKEIGKVPSSYAGRGADAFMNQYNALKPNFDAFYNKVETHANFLINTANRYEETDINIEKQANDLLN